MRRALSVVAPWLIVGGVFADETVAPAKPTLKAEASLSYVRSSGNQPVQTLGAGFSGVRDVQHYRITADGEALYTSREEASSRRIAFAGTFERALSKKYYLFARGAYLDEPRGAISRQTLVEGGVRWFIARNATREATLAGTVGRSFETPVPQEAGQSFMSAGLRFDWKWSPGSATFSQSYILLENIQDSRDVRTTVQSAASLSLNAWIGCKMSHRYSYVRRPAFGRETTDQQFLLSIVATFGPR